MSRAQTLVTTIIIIIIICTHVRARIDLEQCAELEIRQFNRNVHSIRCARRRRRRRTLVWSGITNSLFICNLLHDNFRAHFTFNGNHRIKWPLN